MHGLYAYPESKILCKYFELISLRSIKIPKVRELNFWREEEEEDEDETLVCIYISPYGKYLTIESVKLNLREIYVTESPYVIYFLISKIIFRLWWSALNLLQDEDENIRNESTTSMQFVNEATASTQCNITLNNFFVLLPKKFVHRTPLFVDWLVEVLCQYEDEKSELQ